MRSAAGFMRSDLELISAFREGDDDAYKQLIRRYHVGILNFLSALEQDSSKAEELTLSVFLLILRELHPRRPDVALAHALQLPPPPFFETHRDGTAARVDLYFYRAAFACWSAYRMRPTPPLTLNAGETAAGATRSKSASDSNGDSLHAVGDGHATYLALPEELRPALALREVCGMQYAQIAGVLLISQDEVMARIQCAYEMLRDAMSDAVRRNTVREARNSLPPI
jgi:DNA-directed RNA polymerase specialized sigma24 family protein